MLITHAIFLSDLPRTVCGSVCLGVEKITPFVKIFDVSAIDFDTVERTLSLYAGLRYSPLHVTEFCGEMQGKFKVGLAQLKRKPKF